VILVKFPRLAKVDATVCVVNPEEITPELSVEITDEQLEQVAGGTDFTGRDCTPWETHNLNC